MHEESRLPPPDRWARLAAEERRKRRLRDVIVIILIVGGALAFFASEPVNRKRGAPARYAKSRIVSNARQIGFGLLEFENTYGKLPDASTIPEVRQSTGTNLTLGDSTSNDLFRQLMVTKLIPSENVFGAFEPRSKQPDDVFDDDSHALAAGECGFAYVLGPPSAEDPHRPLAFGPVTPGTRNFNLKMTGGYVVVVRADGSCASIHIAPEGRINLGAKDSFLRPDGSVWNGKPLEIKWPK